MLKVGLIGVGGISGAHIPAWDAMEDVELVALCDIRPELMEPYPDKRHYDNFEDMLANEDLDILDICLPTYLHADYSIKAMEQGIHVICEKPISLKEEDVARVYATAKKMNVKFMIAHVLRFWPEFELIKEIYNSKKYGNLLSGYMNRLGPCPGWSWDNWMKDPDRSGLVPFDLHVHDVDFMVYAFGKPQNVQCHRSKLLDSDYISAVYEYPGFFITAESSWYGAPFPFGAGYRFQFEKAVISFSNGQCIIYESDGNILDLTAKSDGDTGSINLPKSNAYANEIRYFTDCVLTDQWPDKVQPDELTTVIGLLNSL